MLKKTIIKSGITLALATLLYSCDDGLNTIPTDRFASENIVTSQDGIKALLYSAYSNNNRGYDFKDVINELEVCTDMAFNRNGAENRDLIQFINFTVDASSGRISYLWNRSYFTIRDANLVVESLEKANLDESFEKETMAEARYLRAFEYAELYKLFGPVPLRTGTNQDANLPAASADDIKSFIETELIAAAQDLPDPGKEELYGRATKGSALAILAKFYLNTQQWQKVVDVTQQIMNLNYYQLYPAYRDMFFVANEGNKEMIVAWPQLNQDGHTNAFPNGAFPPGFKKAANIPEFEWNSNMANWATQYSLRDEFVDSFDPADDRLQAIVQVYQNSKGETVNLRTTTDNSRSFKFFDQAQVANNSGNDFPVVRYADILLSRAEALNQLNGPTQESVDLVNQVRNRSHAPAYTLAAVGNKSTFKDLILKERGFEFFTEGKRREDLIRNEEYISKAQERGVNAKAYNVLFPIPESEINNNPLISQNEGY
ncbi:RagB/SusD family nutrient uptake outer membrane protein [Zhouia sp. PK063]|uniref:RagB/SusD family nutrient uptake outer membrane protein n=1 Tax=Zhouia sp. PK063 TaxID=3373602 RepID=UPI00378F91AB